VYILHVYTHKYTHALYVSFIHTYIHIHTHIGFYRVCVYICIMYTYIHLHIHRDIYLHRCVSWFGRGWQQRATRSLYCSLPHWGKLKTLGMQGNGLILPSVC